MDVATAHSPQEVVRLPDDQEVEISRTPEDWWRQHGKAGYMDPKLLAPDPDQPRIHMHDHDLDELKESVRAYGVRDSLIVTPLASAPWVTIKPEHDGAYFAIVSGHRRRKAAVEEAVPAVPILVRIYKNQSAFRTDQLLLNATRSDLTPLEEGWYFTRLKQEGHSDAKIAKMVGKAKSDAAHVASRISLTRLAPDIQELIAPKLRKHRKISLDVAARLGRLEVPSLEEVDVLIEDGGISDELRDVDIEKLAENAENEATNKNGGTEARNAFRFFFQRLMLYQARRHAKTAQGMTRFIHRRMLKLPSYRSGHHARGERFVPKKRWQQLLTFIDNATELPCIAWSEDEWKRIVHNRSNTEVRAAIGALRSASSKQWELAKLLEHVVSTRGQGADTKVIDTMIRVTYIDDNERRMPNALVPPKRYVTLWHARKLGFQVDEKPKPEELPDVKDVEKAIASASAS